MKFRRHNVVDLVAYVLTTLALGLIVGAPLGLRFDISCNPFSLDDPFCAFVMLVMLLLALGLFYVAFFMARAWWRNEGRSSIASRGLWLLFAVFFFPYAVILYYWVVYRRRPLRPGSETEESGEEKPGIHDRHLSSPEGAGRNFPMRP